MPASLNHVKRVVATRKKEDKKEKKNGVLQPYPCSLCILESALCLPPLSLSLKISDGTDE